MPSQNKPIEDQLQGKIKDSLFSHIKRDIASPYDSDFVTDWDAAVDEIMHLFKSYAAAERIAEWNQLEASDLDRAVKETVMHMYGRPRIKELQERITQ